METGILQHQTNSQLQSQSDIDEYRIRLQNFINRLNTLPDSSEVEKTPDGKANSIPISFIEMTLDEFFFGLWETENFSSYLVANEIVGNIDLVVTHPVSGVKIRRVGAAAIQIMVDKGANALDVTKKKSNALDMGFPKLKAECVKNAAQSLGKLFGRDLNRKKADNFNPIIKAPVVSIDDLRISFEEKKHKLSEDDMINGYRILDNNETNSFNKFYKYLQSI